jgi:hypothetical protein
MKVFNSNCVVGFITTSKITEQLMQLDSKVLIIHIIKLYFYVVNYEMDYPKIKQAN